MINKTAIFASSLTIFFCVFVCKTKADRCNFCLPTQNIFACILPLDCGVGNGCYSQTWISNGTRIYSKGCLAPHLPACETLNKVYCDLNFVVICCRGDFCNNINPVFVWRPNPPQNLVVADLNTNSVTLSWDLQCHGIYSFQVEYGRVGTATSIISDIHTHQIQIRNLYHGEYRFSVRSLSDGRISNATQITRTIPETENVYCAITSNSTLNSPDIRQTCLPDQQRCSTILYYPGTGKPPYVTKSCATLESCETAAQLQNNRCRPGVSNAVCSFCCEGNACNMNDSNVLADLTCDRISQAERIDCGFPGINGDSCEALGCCYEETGSTLYNKWCFHKKLKPTESETSPTTSTAAATAAFPYWIIIVVVCIVVVIIIFIIVILCIRRRRRQKNKGIYHVDPIYAISNRQRNFEYPPESA